MALKELPDWRGETVLIAASGPSVAQIDATSLHPRVKVVAVKDAWQRFPQARIIYGCDWWWWLARGPGREATPAIRAIGKLPNPNESYALSAAERAHLDAMVHIPVEPGSGAMIWSGQRVRGGWNSAFQIVNALAVRGVKRFLFAGVDCDAPHSYAHGGTYPGQKPQTQRNVDVWMDQWRLAAAEFKARGVEGYIVTKGSRVKAFPYAPRMLERKEMA